MRTQIRHIVGLTGTPVENGPKGDVKEDDRVISRYLKTLTPSELDLWCQEVAPNAVGETLAIQLDELREEFGISRDFKKAIAKTRRPSKKSGVGWCGTELIRRGISLRLWLRRVNHNRCLLLDPYFVAAFAWGRFASNETVVEESDFRIHLRPSGGYYVTFPPAPSNDRYVFFPPDSTVALDDIYDFDDIDDLSHMKLPGILCVAFNDDRIAVFDSVDEAVEVAKKFASLSSEPTADE